MPKCKTAPEELRQMRINDKKCYQEKLSSPPSEIYLCVLGNGATGSPRALYMFTDHGRYLFNCGEGTQRIAHEYKMKLSKLENIFVTHKSWENLGGLLGLSLTVQDIGVPQIILHGPPDIDTLYEYAESFLSTKNLNIVTKCGMDHFFSDSCMEVHYIPIQSDRSATCFDNSPDSDCDHKGTFYHRTKRLKSEEREQNLDVTVAYACRGHSKPGHLQLNRCIEEGVPPGPLLGELKSGKDVTLPSGKVVFSKDVVSEEQKCPVFLVVECPSERFLDAFVNEDKFKTFQASSTSLSDIASLVVHFTPSNILKTQVYQEWISRFPETTCHMILNNDNASLCSAAVHRIQHKLNLLHPRVFSLLHEHKVQMGHLANLRENMVQADTLNRFYLRPAKGLDKTSLIAIDSAAYVQEASITEGFEKSVKQLQNIIKQKEKECGTYDDYPEVVFLGTGSSIPSKVRNVSGILISVSIDKCIMMDCGEGTFGQLVRLYGLHSAQLMVQQLCCIFVSHMHADHHLGLIQLLKSREATFKNIESKHLPLVIIGPRRLHTWLSNYHKMFEPISSLYRFFECDFLKYNFKQISDNDQTFLQKCCCNIDISTVPVNHCPDAHGFILTDNISKWKIVYSGDTTPCDALVTAGFVSHLNLVP